MRACVADRGIGARVFFPVGLSLFCLVLPALAQDAGTGASPDATVVLPAITVEGRPDDAESPTGPIEGYVARRSVTSTKTNTPLREVPQQVSVIGQDQIRAQNVRKVDEAIRYTAGVFTQQFGPDTRNDWFFLRGFDSTQTGLYKDGLQLFSTGLAAWKIDPFGLERVEVLKGPSSMVFGGTAPGGILNLIGKRPTGETSRYVETGFDNNGQVYAGLDVGGRLAEDGSLLYRIATRGHFGGTETDNADDDGAFLAPSFTWRPNDATSLTLLGMYQKDDLGQPNGFLPYEGTETRAATGRIPSDLYIGNPDRDEYRRDQAMIGYEFAHRLTDDFEVRQNLRYSYLSLFYRSIYPFGYTDDTRQQLARINYQTKPEVNLFTVDNQAEAAVATGALDHTLLFGIDYKRYRIADDQATASDEQFPLDLDDPDYDQSTTSPYARYIFNRQVLNQVGFYAQDQVKLDEDWVLTLGGRYDLTGLETDERLTETTSQGDDREFSWRAGLGYLFDNGLTPYVSYSTFFNPTVGVNAAGDPFDPEEGDQYEAGIKYQPPGREISVGLAVFELTRENVLTPDPDNPLNQVQTAEQRSRGFEIEGAGSPLPGLDVIASFTAYDLDITENEDVNEGNTPIGRPEILGSVWADYTLQATVLEGLGFGFGMRYVGESYADEENDLRVDDALLADAALHYERRGWRVGLNVENLLDKTYVASCSGVSSCFYGEGRTVVASLGVTW